MGIPTLDDLAVDGTTVGIRVDINSPLSDSGTLADDARLRAHVDTLNELLDRGGRVAILAHQGRPGGDEFARLEDHAARLSDLLDHPVEYCDATFSADARAAINLLEDGQAVLLENTRFYSEEYMEFPAEKAAETFLVERLAPELDAYVNDAFAAAHRSQPSIVGFPCRVDSYAGRVMERELDVLSNIEETPTPRVYALGGAKIADALDVAESVLDRGLADTILTSGMTGNAFLAASGVDVGEPSESAILDRDATAIDQAAELLDEYGEKIHVPDDVAVSRDGDREEVDVADLPVDAPALDVGEATIAAYADVFETAGTAILNGPPGVFEEDAFALGTREIFGAAASAEYSIVGGGDTAASLRQLGIDGFDHVSTGGGAALRLLTGGTLPAVEVLRQDSEA
ncbi:phosphoglycerate kinase [Halorientalis brevis]|uniref:Phosphoglycerate kinase n=1 Tax=Halorientalis brevis TaxID=1126241 RepID=A0ABD6CBU6_9EURY|nr:phosphoglycerate kinase [Halorientalis brevis]